MGNWEKLGIVTFTKNTKIKKNRLILNRKPTSPGFTYFYMNFEVPIEKNHQPTMS
jgi:hypothetical protein